MVDNHCKSDKAFGNHNNHKCAAYRAHSEHRLSNQADSTNNRKDGVD
jgi:hypothetical protein